MKMLWMDIRETYSSAWAFAFVCPMLFLIPVIFEFAQHVVEINAGMYLSKRAAHAAASDPSRMTWGFLKTIAISLPTYWTYRFVISGRNASYARGLDARALMLWGIAFLILIVGLSWLSLFGPPLGHVLGLAGSAETVAKSVLGGAQAITGVYLTAWLVAWSQGNLTVGPLRSTRIMSGYFWHTVGLMIAGILPLMAIHYASLLAVGQLRPVVWLLMTLDSLVVGFLAVTMHGASAIAARRAATHKGVSLLPTQVAHEPLGAFAAPRRA